MRVFEVGGCVRDSLLGRTPKDKDYVVVGSTPDEMVAQGFKQVGADFPVFLHPCTGDEYALARTERKTAPGYNGFAVSCDPTVTLEDDLRRRDLTINAMARDIKTGEIIDPFNGKDDLEQGILRHVSEAFAEDPVRVLRIARFAARYNFTVHPDTLTLLSKLVTDGELAFLTAERVWAEFEKALSEPYMNQFFYVLDCCGATSVLFPEFSKSNLNLGWNPRRLSLAALHNATALQQFALFGAYMSEADINSFCHKYKAPNEFRDVAVKASVLSDFSWDYVVTVDSMFALMNRVDAFRQPNIVRTIASAFLLTLHREVNTTMHCVLTCMHEAQKVTFQSLSALEKATLKGNQIGQAIADKRKAAILGVLRQRGEVT